jgi:hypothetical protein
MDEQKYKGQLFTFEVVQPASDNHWTAKAQVRFSSNNTVRFFRSMGSPKLSPQKKKRNSSSLKQPSV